jgi:hypothetical protein
VKSLEWDVIQGQTPFDTSIPDDTGQEYTLDDVQPNDTIECNGVLFKYSGGGLEMLADSVSDDE